MPCPGRRTKRPAKNPFENTQFEISKDGSEPNHSEGLHSHPEADPENWLWLATDSVDSTACAEQEWTPILTGTYSLEELFVYHFLTVDYVRSRNQTKWHLEKDQWNDYLCERVGSCRMPVWLSADCNKSRSFRHDNFLIPRDYPSLQGLVFQWPMAGVLLLCTREHAIRKTAGLTVKFSSEARSRKWLKGRSTLVCRVSEWRNVNCLAFYTLYRKVNDKSIIPVQMISSAVLNNGEW
jgi:hypothetical protein